MMKHFAAIDLKKHNETKFFLPCAAFWHTAPVSLYPENDPTVKTFFDILI